MLSIAITNMDPFNPAVHYGPNDAGVSSVSIALVVLGILGGSWAFGATYALISNFFKNKNKEEEQ